MSEGANELMKAAGDFISKVVNVPLEEVGGLFADRVRLFRAKNWIKDYAILDEYAKKHNIKLRNVPLKTLMPMLDGMTIEDDPDLKQKWRALFINTVKENSNYDSPLFAKILSEMSTADAHVFKEVFNANIHGWKDGDKRINIRVGGFKSNSSPARTDRSEIYYDNLLRLRLIAEDRTRHAFGDVYFFVTQLGFEFMMAVTSDIE